MSLRSLTCKFMVGASNEKVDWKNDQELESLILRAKDWRKSKLLENCTSANCTEDFSAIFRPNRSTSGKLFTPGNIFFKASVIRSFSPLTSIGRFRLNTCPSGEFVSLSSNTVLPSERLPLNVNWCGFIETVTFPMVRAPMPPRSHGVLRTA